MRGFRKPIAWMQLESWIPPRPAVYSLKPSLNTDRKWLTCHLGLIGLLVFQDNKTNLHQLRPRPTHFAFARQRQVLGFNVRIVSGGFHCRHLQFGADSRVSCLGEPDAADLSATNDCQYPDGDGFAYALVAFH